MTVRSPKNRLFYRVIFLISGIMAVVFLGLFGLRVGQRLYAQFTPPVLCAADFTTQNIGTWTQGTAQPVSRTEVAGAGLNGMLYVAGGFIGQWEVVTLVERYDPSTGVWETLASLPIPVHHTAMVALNNEMILTGGYNHSFESEVANAWRYDPAENVWIPLPDMPYTRAAHATVVVNGMLYVIGGDGQESLTMMVYDPIENTWDTARAPMLGPARDHIHAVVIDGLIYAIGGRNAGVHTGVYDRLDRYNPQTDQWETLAAMDYPTSSMAVGVINNKIHVAGGEDIDGDCVIRVHEVYDPATNAWETVGEIPTPRHGLASAIIDNRWYIVGGSKGAGERAVYNFTPVVEIFTPDS